MSNESKKGSKGKAPWLKITPKDDGEAFLLRVATKFATKKTKVRIVIHTGGMPVEAPIDEIVVAGNGDIYIHAYT